MGKRFTVGVLLLMGTYIFGAVGYQVLSPKSSFLDCLYMSVITVASVGFTEVIDSSVHPLVRSYTIALIMIGMAVHVYAISVVTAFVVEGDLSQYFWKRRMSKKISSMNGHYVVLGGGETGMRIAEELIATKRDFVVVDSDQRAVEELQKYKNVAIIQGTADHEDVLEAAGIQRAAAVAVALGSDRDNLVATLGIRTLNPKIRIVVKEYEPGMASRFRRAGADAIVNPASIGGLRLVSEMVRPSVVSFLDLMLRDPINAYRIEEILLTENSPWVGRELKDIPLRADFDLLVAAIRPAEGGTFVYNPKDSWILEKGQTLVVLGRVEDVNRARDVAQVI